MISIRSAVVVLVCSLAFSGIAAAQEPKETPAAPAPAAAPAADVPAAPGAPGMLQTGTPQTGAPQTGAPAVAPVHQQWNPKMKVPYTGPTTTIALPPTPMLDEEGRQRLDPDGKPMFNPPVKQQRDKYGHPLFDDAGKPVFQTATELGYDEAGKKLHVNKEKPPKTTAMNVKSGVMTVDGLPGKAALNYDIADLKYIYFYAPWIGTAVVSNQPFPGAKEQKDAFNDKSLKVVLGDHTFELTSQERLLGKKPEPAYVLLDRDFKLPTQQPVMGYGATLKQPYAWPGVKEAAEDKKVAKAPPLPANMRPTKLLPPCPKGQMRRSPRPVLPGEAVPDEPCVPIVAGAPAPAAAPAPVPQAASTNGPTSK